MKSCPKCNRTFPDEGQKFCTFDGGLLIAPQAFDPNATMRATSIDLNAASERPTSRDLPDPNATLIESYPATVALPRTTGPTGPPTGANTADIANQAPPPPPAAAPPPPPTAQTSQPLPPPPQPTSAPLPAHSVATSAPLPAAPVAKKKSKMPWIIVGVLLFLLLGGGVLVGAFFVFVKPRLDQVAERRPENQPIVQPTIETVPSPSVEQPSPTPEEFVPPPNTVQFQNSDANLDGKLAEHYLDFSFYYPQSWRRDPKAGVPGATNFVKVDRSLPPNFIQENFAVGWYTSTGTFDGDRENFPQRVTEYSAALAKAFEDYRKVSEGPTKVNSLDAYEFRWEGVAKGTEKGDVQLWGRVVFLPTGKEGDTAGATLAMLSTSLAPELKSVEDIGQKGEATVILDSFRFGKK
jgi:hypothetical protein